MKNYRNNEIGWFLKNENKGNRIKLNDSVQTRKIFWLQNLKLVESQMLLGPYNLEFLKEKSCKDFWPNVFFEFLVIYYKQKIEK